MTAGYYYYYYDTRIYKYFASGVLAKQQTTVQVLEIWYLKYWKNSLDTKRHVTL
jgi:hypothetical protein